MPTNPDPILKLEALAQKAGPPNPTLLEALLAGTSEAELIEQGKTIDSKRLITDGARLYDLAWSYWTSLSAEEQQKLKGVSTDLLVLGIHQCLHLEQTRKNRLGTIADERAGKSENDALRVQAREDSMALRDEIGLAMRDAAAHDKGKRSALESAVGNAATNENLALGLESLAKLLESWLGDAQTNATLEAQLKLANLSAADVQQMREQAQKLRIADIKASQIATSPKISQSDLDKNDGINIHILGRLIRAFDMAHDRNPGVPRLVPIAARRLFKAPKPQDTEPVPPPPGEGGESSGPA